MKKLPVIFFMCGLFASMFLCADQQTGFVLPPGLLQTSGLNPTFIAQFSLFIAVLLLWTVIWGKLFKRFLRLPVIAGQIFGGILLGPSLLNIAQFSLFSNPLSLIDHATGYVYTVLPSDLFLFFVFLISFAMTVSYLLWVAGHETDLKDIWRIGGTAINAGFLGAIFPVVMNVAVLYFLFGADWPMPQLIGFGLIFAATSVSIPIAMLFSYNKMHLKSSKATLGAAVIDDILAVIFLSVFFLCLQMGMLGTMPGIIMPEHGGSGILESIGYLVIAFLVFVGAGFFIIAPLMRWLQAQHYSHLMVPFANGIMLLYFAFAELFGGLSGITGAYFAGLFHHMADVQHKVKQTIAPFVNAILLPLFLCSIGLQINLRILSGFDWIMVVVIFIIAIVSKLAGCWVATALSNLMGLWGKKERWSGLETYLFGSAMVARGEVDLMIATILYGAHIITLEQYVIAVMVIVLTTVASPVMLAFGFSKLDTLATQEDYTINIGVFNVIGTRPMFDIIMRRIEATGQFKTSVSISEGREIVNIENQQVKIILCPDEGIIFKGNSQNIEHILRIVKNAITEDMGRLAIF
ncbi:MAG: cation:proton antiporter [bacterium]|nr:cation:proton antiporter [bacterium]